MKKTPLPPLTGADPTRAYTFKANESWGISDPDRFRVLMDEARTLVEPGSYLGDNMFVWMRNLSALDDAIFRTAWQSNIATPADESTMWRRYILCCAAFHCVHLEGDFVECGVLHGTAIKTVIDYFGKDNFEKTFWGYDAFDYNPVAGQKFEGQEPGLYDRVRARFSGYGNVRLMQGLLPDSLSAGSPERIAYLHIDLNSAEYEIAVLEILFDRLVVGGILILDDYEWAGFYRAQKIAEDPWFSARGYRVIPLPTGQGLVIKR